jgi:hypothetical protein
MTSKIIVNTIEADTGISSVTFASNINLQNDSSILVSSSGVTLGTGSTIAAPSANELALSTNSAERLRVDSAGLIGIGTDNPGTNLDVLRTSNDTGGIVVRNTNNSQGNARAQVEISGGDNADGRLKIECNGTEHTFRQDGSGNLQIHNASAERLRITSDGKMGLGISSPARGGLHIHKAATAELHLTDDTTGSGSGDGFTLFSTSSSAGVWYRENAPLRFATYNTERVRISSGGNVGINETAPDRQLHVKSGANSNDGVIRIESSNDNIMDVGTDGTGHFLNCVNTDPFRIKFAGTERVRIAANGDIGIANASPTNWGSGVPTIEIKGTVSSGGNATRSGAIAFESGSGSNGYAALWGQNGGIHIYTGATDRASATYAAQFNSSGNLAFASGNGIDFSATGDGSGTMSSELLDDYEEGSWTPTITYGGTSATLSGGTYAYYTKIGNVVTIHFRIIQTNRNTSSGSIRMSGLPYNKGGGSVYNHGMVQVDSGGNMPSGAGSIMMYLGSTDVRFLYQTNTSHADFDASHCVNGTSFYGFATYFMS